MKQFSYVIKDEIGLHARPAGLLAKEAKKYQSTVTISCNGKSAAASKLMAIMGMDNSVLPAEPDSNLLSSVYTLAGSGSTGVQRYHNNSPLLLLDQLDPSRNDRIQIVKSNCRQPCSTDFQHLRHRQEPVQISEVGKLRQLFDRPGKRRSRKHAHQHIQERIQ